MGELIELVLKNPFLLLLILGWVVTMFRGKPAENEQQNKQERPKRTHTQRQSPSQQTGTPIGRIEPEKRPVIKQEEVQQSLSIEDHREEQLQRLQAQLGAGSSYEDYEEANQPSGLGPSITDNMQQSIAKQPAMKNNLKHKLNHQGLVESIIMAEVIGLPRAKKRHHRDLNR